MHEATITIRSHEGSVSDITLKVAKAGVTAHIERTPFSRIWSASYQITGQGTHDAAIAKSRAAAYNGIVQVGEALLAYVARNEDKGGVTVEQVVTVAEINGEWYDIFIKEVN